MLTNIHEPKMVLSEAINYKTGENIMKPEAVMNYNVNMSSVDKTNMMISLMNCSRESMKWYKQN